MMTRIACVAIAMALSVLSAHGQARNIVKGGAVALEELGASPAVRELVATAARKSSLAKSVLEAFGYKVEGDAASQLQSLSAMDLGTGITRLSELGQHSHGLADAASSDPRITCAAFCRAAVSDYGKYTLGAGGTVPLSIYVDALVREQKR